MKELGNCALRSVLEQSLLAEVIGRRIVAAGLLSEEQFQALRKEALRDVTTSASDVASLVRLTKHNTLATGSWEIKTLVMDDAGSYQILSAWVKDHRMQPMAPHKHEGVEFLIILKGAILVSIDVESQIVNTLGTVTIPAGAVHSVTPLERDTQMLVVVSPPESEYVIEESA